jgi:hypothetical protein
MIALSEIRKFHADMAHRDVLHEQNCWCCILVKEVDRLAAEIDDLKARIG